MKRGFCARCGIRTDGEQRFVVRVFVQQRTTEFGQRAHLRTNDSAQVSVCRVCADLVFEDAAVAITKRLQEGTR